MLGIVVTGHGRFASGLYSALEFIAGEQQNVEVVDFTTEHSIEELKVNLEQALDSLRGCTGVLVLSDLPGGSPFEAAVKCKMERADQQIEVVAGTNLPLLIASATMTAVFDDPFELAEAMIPEGRTGIRRS